MVVTDATLAAPRGLMDVVGEALKAGAPAVQLRNKGAAPRALVELGRELRAVTRDVGALLIVNDRVDVALAVGADGVHLGPEDLPVAAIRRIVTGGFLIGRSADEAAVARQAEVDGADYIGCGTVYPTSTKIDAGDVIGLEGLARVIGAVSLPVIGIGGITAVRASEVKAHGAAGAAVVGAVMCSPDVRETVQSLMAPWG